TAQTNDSFLVLGQELLVDPGNVVISVEESNGGHLDQIAKAGAILSEEREMETRVPTAAGFALVQPAGSDIRFVAKNRVQAGCAALPVEFDGAAQVAVVGQRHGIHATLFYS